MPEQLSHMEAELFKQLAIGSEPALQQLVLLYEKQVMAVIQAIVHNRYWAREVWSHTMQALWEHRQEMPALDSPLAWLLVVARHKGVNKLRDEKRGATTALDWLPELIGPWDTAYEMEGKEIRALVEQAMHKLTPREQEVLRLRVEDGLSRKEVAAYLNTSEHTVKNQWRNAVLTLRKQLAKLFSSIFI